MARARRNERILRKELKNENMIKQETVCRYWTERNMPAIIAKSPSISSDKINTNLRTLSRIYDVKLKSFLCS
jgi:hypothetical protein